jgi:hypothetical protein
MTTRDPPIAQPVRQCVVVRPRGGSDCRSVRGDAGYSRAPTHVEEYQPLMLETNVPCAASG